MWPRSMAKAYFATYFTHSDGGKQLPGLGCNESFAQSRAKILFLLPFKLFNLFSIFNMLILHESTEFSWVFFFLKYLSVLAE